MSGFIDIAASGETGSLKTIFNRIGSFAKLPVKSINLRQDKINIALLSIFLDFNGYSSQRRSNPANLS
jgi:hypothetical protein